jgi:hypothetical protein
MPDGALASDLVELIRAKRAAALEFDTAVNVLRVANDRYNAAQDKLRKADTALSQAVMAACAITGGAS